MKVVLLTTNEKGCLWTQNTVTPHQFYAVPGNKMGRLIFLLSYVHGSWAWKLYAWKWLCTCWTSLYRLNKPTHKFPLKELPYVDKVSFKNSICRISEYLTTVVKVGGGLCSFRALKVIRNRWVRWRWQKNGIAAKMSATWRFVRNFFNSHSGVWSADWVHSARRPLLACCTCFGWLWGWRIWRDEDRQGKSMYSEKSCPSATLSTTNPTWQEPGANPGRRGGKPATNRCSYGAATGLYVRSASVMVQLKINTLIVDNMVMIICWLLKTYLVGWTVSSSGT
jgi:hypothetical protein